jgi:hypothetical protein
MTFEVRPSFVGFALKREKSSHANQCRRLRLAPDHSPIRSLGLGVIAELERGIADPHQELKAIGAFRELSAHQYLSLAELLPLAQRGDERDRRARVVGTEIECIPRRRLGNLKGLKITAELGPPR